MSELFPEKPQKEINTDVEWGVLFEKIASEHSPKTHTEHRALVVDLFHGNEKVNQRFDKWSEKIAFDKNKLKEIYANSVH
jgi:hypothetical protein